MELFSNGTEDLRGALRDISASLAARKIYVGTSSWKYEGWLGSIYSRALYEHRGRVAAKRFDAECLAEYAQTFRTVCVDAGFYRFPSEAYVARLCEQVPAGFLLSFKVTEDITIKNFPGLVRYGQKAGRVNENFLNADLFSRAFLVPLEAHREKIGVLIFEFSKFHERDFAAGRDFVSALDGFLGSLPHGWAYGVEVRNASLLQAEYFATLRRHGVAHVFNSWTAMPSVTEQIAFDGAFTADFFAARFLLKPGRKYTEAVEAFSPYEAVAEIQNAERVAMQALASRTPKARSFLFVNNRLEGNAPGTIAAALERWR